MKLVQSRQQTESSLRRLREIAFDWAISETLTGDADRARSAIKLAEDAQVSNGWTQLLTAQTEFSAGQYAEAISRLETIVNSNDVDVRYAAQSLMAISRGLNGDDPAFIEWMHKVRSLSTRVGPDAKWFRAQAEWADDYEIAKEILDEVLKTHPRPAYFVTRAQLTAVSAMQEKSMSGIEKAKSDLEYAELFMGDTFKIHEARLLLHLWGHEIARLNYDAIQVDSHLEELRDLTAKSNDSAFPRTPSYLTSVIEALVRLHEFPAAFELAESYDLADSVSIEYPASHLFGHLETREGLARFEKLKVTPDNPHALTSLAFFLADLPERRNELGVIYEKLRDSPKFTHRGRALTILALMGDRDRLVAETERLRASSKGEASFWGLKEFMAVILGTSALIDMDPTKQMIGTTCMIHYAQGILQLAERKPALAKVSFQACVDSGSFGFFEYNWARAMLARMNRDPSWPTWAQQKEKPK